MLDLPDADALPMAALALVERLVPCDMVSHNAIDLELGRATIHTTGPLPDADTIGVFAAHAAENPLVAYQDATGDLSPLRLSDFLTARQFRRRPIYNLVYRELGVQFQLAFGAGGDPGQVVGIALNRGHRTSPTATSMSSRFCGRCWAGSARRSASTMRARGSQSD